MVAHAAPPLGLVTQGAPDYEGVTKQVMRTDFYEEAMKEIGYTHDGMSTAAETFFDGSKFDPKGDMEAYAASFSVKCCSAQRLLVCGPGGAGPTTCWR